MRKVIDYIFYKLGYVRISEIRGCMLGVHELLDSLGELQAGKEQAE